MSLFPKLIATVTVGERGQIVIPTEARTQLGIEPGSKLVVFLPPAAGVLFIAKPDVFEERARKMHEHALKMVQEVEMHDSAEEAETNA